MIPRHGQFLIDTRLGLVDQSLIGRDTESDNCLQFAILKGMLVAELCEEKHVVSLPKPTEAENGGRTYSGLHGLLLGA